MYRWRYATNRPSIDYMIHLHNGCLAQWNKAIKQCEQYKANPLDYTQSEVSGAIELGAKSYIYFMIYVLHSICAMLCLMSFFHK